jgi:predicted component of type VI protein secretion system
VRIGRSPFASLRLREPFVSEWQAVVRFHGERTTYLDLGSKNPTRIHGRPVERNVEVVLDENTEVCIGSLRLRFERIAQPSISPDPGSAEETAFPQDRSREPERPTGTVLLAPERRAAQAARGQTVLGLTAHSEHATRTSNQSLPGAYRSYRAAALECVASARRELQHAPAAARAARALELSRQFPELLHEVAFRELAEGAGVDSVQLGHLDLQDWLARLCGLPKSAIDMKRAALTMERVGRLLELFASAFIDSRRAHQRARRKLALDCQGPPVNALQQTEDPHALLAYLLNPDPQLVDRSHELRRTLADFAMHQIALLSAVVEGARAMLAQLGPEALHEFEPADAPAVLERHAALGKLWPYAARRLLRKYLVRHHDLTQTDHFTRELFGREFTRRYHAIADSAVGVPAQSEPS